MRADEIQIGVTYCAHEEPSRFFVLLERVYRGGGSWLYTYEMDGVQRSEGTTPDKDWSVQLPYTFAPPYLIQEMAL